MICWSCQKEGGAGPFCAACQAVLPPGGEDRFAVLGLPRRFGVDVGAAEATYKDLSRKLHPDRFAKADPQARKASLARTVELNDAWRTIKDPARRAAYLLELAGFGLAGDDRKAGMENAATRKVTAPPSFLIEILELRDELAEAKRGNDAGKVARMTEEMRQRADSTLAALGAQLDAGQFEEAARSLSSLRYFERFLEESTAPGPNQGAVHG